MNKVTLKTDVLKSASNKAVKGSGRLTMLAITKAIGIELKDGDLILTTTNNVNNLVVRVKGAAPKELDFYVATDSELFQKLISKQTTESITLELTENMLKVQGNGDYELPIIIGDDEVSSVRIPEIKLEKVNHKIVSKEDIQKLLKYNSLALSKSFDDGFLMDYNVKDKKIVTFNRLLAVRSVINLETDNMLIPANLAELFEIFDEKEINFYREGERVLFETESISLFGEVKLSEADKYPHDDINSIIGVMKTSNELTVKKAAVLNALDRVSLFTGNSDTISIVGNKDKVIFSSQDRRGYEGVQVTKGTTSFDLVGSVRLSTFKSALNTIQTEDIIISYDRDNGILIEENGSSMAIPFKNDSSENYVEDVEEEVEEAEEIILD